MEFRTIAVSQATLPRLLYDRPNNDLIGAVQHALSIHELLAGHLVHLDPEELIRCVARQALPAVTENTETDTGLLRNYLQTSRRQGYTIEGKEYTREAQRRKNVCLRSCSSGSVPARPASPVEL